MDGRRRAGKCVDHSDLPLSWSQGSKREVSPRMLYRSRKQPWPEAFEDPVPVRRRAEVQAKAISHVYGDLPTRIGKVIADLSSSAARGSRVPAGHDRNKDGRDYQPDRSWHRFRPLTYRRSRLWYLTPDGARPFPQVPATAFVTAALPAVPVASAVRQPSACVLQQGNLRCPRPWPGVRKTGLDITAQEGSG
jgi:hypothetical protein